MRIPACFIFAFIFIASARAADEKPATQPSLVSYTDQEHGFTIGHPARWESKPSPQAPVVAMFIDKERGDAGVFDNLNVVFVRVPQSPTADQLLAAIVPQLQQQFKDFKLIEKSKRTVDGYPAVKLVYTAKPGPILVQLQQNLVITPTAMYTLTVTSGPGQYDKLVPTIDAIVDSFKVQKLK